MKFNLVVTVFLILFGFSIIISGTLPSFSQTVDNPQLFTPIAIGATSNIQIPTSEIINQTKIIQVNMNALKAEQVDVSLFGHTITISKVNSKMSSSGWNDSCVYSNDLYINIGGTWTVQDEHYLDNTGGPCNQFHVRAWEINDNSVIGAAHEEVAKYKTPWDRINIQHISTSGPNYTEINVQPFLGFYHGLTGFDSAEDEVTGEFTGGCWSSAADSHNMGNEYTRKYFRNTILESTAYNDGYATVINCS